MKHKHTTRQLLWEKYRAAHPDGYNYSRFSYRYRRWKPERDVVLRQQRVQDAIEAGIRVQLRPKLVFLRGIWEVGNP
jgi:transposase